MKAVVFHGIGDIRLTSSTICDTGPHMLRGTFSGMKPATIPRLLDKASTGSIEPASVITQQEPVTEATEAYRQFNQRCSGWIKVELDPAG